MASGFCFAPRVLQVGGQHRGALGSAGGLVGLGSTLDCLSPLHCGRLPSLGVKAVRREIDEDVECFMSLACVHPSRR